MRPTLVSTKSTAQKGDIGTNLIAKVVVRVKFSVRNSWNGKEPLEQGSISGSLGY